MNKEQFCNRFEITESQFCGESKVGGYLYLSGLTSIPDGFNPTVGGSLYLSGLTAEVNTPPAVLTFQDGKYCVADGVFGEVVSEKNSAGYSIWKLRQVGCDKVFFLVEQDGVTAHGESVRDAMIDLRFKAEDRDKSYYEGMTAESELSYEDAAICYRVLTGACSFGVSDFLKNRLRVEKDKYSVREIIDLTRGEYGKGLSQSIETSHRDDPDSNPHMTF